MKRLTDQQLQEAIIATICYFDLFDYPLTLSELSQWLYIPTAARHPLGSIRVLPEELLRLTRDDKNFSEKIETARGFYFVRGRSHLIKERLARYNLAESKYRKAQRFIRVLKLFPFIRFIGICNTLGYSNAKRNSDIDLLIFVANGHLWTARWWTVSLAKLLGIRPTPAQSRDRFCFSFFLSDRSLDLSSIRIHAEDVYLSYWAATIVPIYDAGGYFNRFRQANQNLFIQLPHVEQYYPISRRKVSNDSLGRAVQKTWEWLQDGFWEPMYEQLQKKIMPHRLQELGQQEGGGVIMNKQMLKFHDRDRRHEFHEEWRKRRSFFKS